MSDVVAVALITSVATLASALIAILGGLLRERLNAKQANERHEKELRAQETRVRAEAVRAGRSLAVERLRKWVERHLVLFAELKKLTAVAPAAVGDLSGIIDELEKTIQSSSPEEASVNVAVSHFSSHDIVLKVRKLESLRSEILGQLRAPDLQEAVKAGNLWQQRHELWGPISKTTKRMDEEVATLNALLEDYLMGTDLA